MNTVAAIIGRIEQVGIFRTAHHVVEIEHRVEACLFVHPVIDLVADLGLVGVPAGVRDTRNHAVPGNDGRADDSDVLGFDAGDDVLHAADDLIGGRAAPDVVGAHE